MQPRNDGQDSRGDHSPTTLLLEQWATEIEQGRNADAAETALNFMQAVAEHIEANPADYDRSQKADQAEANGDWQTARRLYEDELNELKTAEMVLNRELRQSRAHLQLARVDRAEGNLGPAFDRASVAVRIARGADCPYFLAMTLDQFAEFALLVGETDEALAACADGLAVLSDERLHDVMRAMLLLRRAEALFAAQDTTGTRRSLDEAWQAMESASGLAGAGVHAQIASWWRLQAKLQSLQDDWPVAREAWERAVSSARHAVAFWNGSEWRFNRMLANLLVEFATAAEHAGDSRLAHSLLIQSQATVVER